MSAWSGRAEVSGFVTWVFLLISAAAFVGAVWFPDAWMAEIGLTTIRSLFIARDLDGWFLAGLPLGVAILAAGLLVVSRARLLNGLAVGCLLVHVTSLITMRLSANIIVIGLVLSIAVGASVWNWRRPESAEAVAAHRAAGTFVGLGVWVGWVSCIAVYVETEMFGTREALTDLGAISSFFAGIWLPRDLGRRRSIPHIAAAVLIVCSVAFTLYSAATSEERRNLRLLEDAVIVR